MLRQCQRWNIWLSRRSRPVQIDYSTIIRFFRLRDLCQDFARVLPAHLLFHRLRFWRGKFDLSSSGYFRSVAHDLRSLLHLHVLLVSAVRPHLRIPANHQIHADFPTRSHGHLPRLCHLRLPTDVPTPGDLAFGTGQVWLIYSDFVVFHVYRGHVPPHLRHETLPNPHWRTKWNREQWRGLLWRPTRHPREKLKATAARRLWQRNDQTLEIVNDTRSKQCKIIDTRN